MCSSDLITAKIYCSICYGDHRSDGVCRPGGCPSYYSRIAATVNGSENTGSAVGASCTERAVGNQIRDEFTVVDGIGSTKTGLDRSKGWITSEVTGRRGNRDQRSDGIGRPGGRSSYYCRIA